MIIAGDGIIAQIERFAGKYVFNRLNTKVLNTAIQQMVAKAEKPTGNTFVVICNTSFWNEVQNTLSGWIRDWKTTGTFMFSKAANDYVKVGATFASYEFAGK